MEYDKADDNDSHWRPSSLWLYHLTKVAAHNLHQYLLPTNSYTTSSHYVLFYYHNSARERSAPRRQRWRKQRQSPVKKVCRMELGHHRTYSLCTARCADGLATTRELILAVLRSLRNSDKLILPSLSMSASSRSGSIEPLRPVCWCHQRIQAQLQILKLLSSKEGIRICTNHFELFWSDKSISVNIEFFKSWLWPLMPFLRVVLLQLMDVHGSCSKLREIYKSVGVAINLLEQADNIDQKSALH